MTFKKYAKKSPFSSNNIEAIPFIEVQELFSDIKADLTEARLAEINETRLERYKRDIKQAELDADDEAAYEYSHESVKDFKKVEELEDPDDINEIAHKANKEAIKLWLEKYSLEDTWGWLGSQLLARFGNYKLPPATPEGLYSPKEFIGMNIVGKPVDIGIWRLLTQVSRGNLMKNQTSEEHLSYCGLVPLYLAAQKRDNNVMYNSWVRRELSWVVDKDLLDAMLCDPPQGEYDSNELINIRDAGLTYIGTGKLTKGKVCMYNPSTYHQLVNINESAIGNLPRYARAMLCQIWSAHPSHSKYQKYMVLDPYNWDNVPEPLVPVKVSTTKANAEIVKKPRIRSDLGEI
jgi:hypothetical protein